MFAARILILTLRLNVRVKRPLSDQQSHADEEYDGEKLQRRTQKVAKLTSINTQPNPFDVVKFDVKCVIKHLIWAQIIKHKSVHSSENDKKEMYINEICIMNYAALFARQFFTEDEIFHS